MAKKYKLELTKNQLRALQCYLWTNPCEAGCCYEEYQDKKPNCDRCKFTKASNELMEMLDIYEIE